MGSNAQSIFNIDSIGLYAGGAGGSGMRFKVFISNDSLFANPETTVMIADRGTVSNASNPMYPIQYNKLIELKGEENLYLRIYPWYNGSSSGKTICLYGICVKGVVDTENTSISEVDAASIFDFHYNVLKDRIKINISVSKRSDVEIKLHSIDGRTIESMNIKNVMPNQNRESFFSTNNLSSGVYFFTVRSFNTIKSFKWYK